MIKIIKKTIKKSFNLAGIDIVRLSKSPAYTLLGLKNLPIKTVIDVGANTGQFARFISKFFPEAYIYCFEPLTEPYKELQKWVLSKKGKVIPYNFALGDNEGTFEMFRHIDHSPSSSFLETTKINEKNYPFMQRKEKILVEVRTLDNIIEKGNISIVPDILVKLDVQGYENKVIKGATSMLNKVKACILEINLENLYLNQANFKDIVIILDDHGFGYKGNLNQSYSKEGQVLFIDAVFIKEKNKF